ARARRTAPALTPTRPWLARCCARPLRAAQPTMSTTWTRTGYRAGPVRGARSVLASRPCASASATARCARTHAARLASTAATVGYPGVVSTIRRIAQIGEPVLRERAREVSPEQLRSAEFQQFIDDLIATMRQARGAGLAANQVFEPMSVCA